ncbi:hypothetical protein Tdes44962_MAKER07368 [Teratosphaeria destructans]|uniref:Uncharacterized protein n=1 Tax=Teratosphaeria destructans TaxID=418781 RepID=A0A9W7W602_9PEZI|nr:hypothetical protein Tdes44962_MAKER07368 [Teratosphaeria destructans]
MVRPCPNDCAGPEWWNPYGVELVDDDGGNMPPPVAEYGGIVELADGTPVEVGLSPSDELLLGGVSRLPTLVKEVAVGPD